MRDLSWALLPFRRRRRQLRRQLCPRVAYLFQAGRQSRSRHLQRQLLRRDHLSLMRGRLALVQRCESPLARRPMQRRTPRRPRLCHRCRHTICSSRAGQWTRLSSSAREYGYGSCRYLATSVDHSQRQADLTSPLEYHRCHQRLPDARPGPARDHQARRVGLSRPRGRSKATCTVPSVAGS